MPKFTVSHKSAADVAKTFDKVKTYLNSSGNDFSKFDSKIKCTFDDNNKSGDISGSQFKANFKVLADGAGARTDITVDLPLMLTPFKSKVEEMLKKSLAKLIS